ncbi:hypothetical protein C2869_05415 [Saccharobesus litoralis]|uniref:Prolyl 4-hydroxylase alpha subunit Fe(2+) 2OG dioxygenase domain-containing protein n=1 Tax=Saccharobesus litoralis TaxID=2172099 RepID=A0A2S0VNW6_9ALTE|nr:2OG-Fe(II) oxygenase [Saccharobesus litoralis]AWB65915.1 hypothetical protein C2869_05415 [Saccharobesus litoralis]
MTAANINNFLQSLQHFADTELIPCIGGRSELPTQPGLKVKGRQISLPVVQQDLEWLCQQGNPSPFGKGYDTVLDSEIRNSIEFEAQDIDLLNPNWQPALQALTETIANQMAIDFQIKAELFKLLVYKEGGHFKFHQDTEKSQGMFASLIVQLPSRHQGGALICRFADQEFCFDFGTQQADSEFNIYYAAHYADVHHQVEKIEQGARLALVYNLVQPADERQISANLHQELLAETQSLVPQVFSALENEQHALLLQHEYTEQSLSELGFAAAKGQDRALIKALLAVNNQLPLEHKLDFIISRLTYSVSSQGYGGYGDRYDDDDMNWEEIDESDPDFDLCFDSKGQLIPMGDFSVDKIYDLNSHDIKPMTIDTLDEMFWGEGDEEIEGFMGNYGPSKETTYARYLLAILPAYPTHAGTQSQVLQAHKIGLMAQDLNQHANNAWLQNHYDLALKQLLNQWLVEQKSDNHWHRNLGEQDLAIFTNLVQAAIFTKNIELCQTAIRTVSHCFKDNLSSESHAAEIVNLLKDSIACFGWQAIAPLITPTLEQLNSFAIFQVSTTLATNNPDSDMQAQLISLCVNAICREQNDWQYDNCFKKTLVPLAVNLCQTDWYASSDTRQQFLTACLEKGKSYPAFLAALIQNLINDTSADNKKPWLKTLISTRLDYLDKEISKPTPVFSWSMPQAEANKHDMVVFLRSVKQQAQITGYDGIAMARNDVVSVDPNWILPEFYIESNGDFQLPKSHYGFSATMQAKGRGKQAYVQIEKDKRYDELKCKLHTLRKQEADKLKQFALQNL